MIAVAPLAFGMIPLLQLLALCQTASFEGRNTGNPASASRSMGLDAPPAGLMVRAKPSGATRTSIKLASAVAVRYSMRRSPLAKSFGNRLPQRLCKVATESR